MPPIQYNTFQLLLENRLLRLLSESGELPPEGVRIASTFAGRAVVLQVAPLPGPAAPQGFRTPCQRDCLKALGAAGGPMTRPKIMAAMEAAGDLWGESTVAVALADLVASGALENSRKRGGYYLPDSPRRTEDPRPDRE